MIRGKTHVELLVELKEYIDEMIADPEHYTPRKAAANLFGWVCGFAWDAGHKIVQMHMVLDITNSLYQERQEENKNAN